MLNLLLVEDDIDLATAVIEYLEMESIQCDSAYNGLTGMNLIENNDYQVIILDLNLPKMDGLEVCKKMRELGDDTPVLMLTARDSLNDKVAGFNAGTDDYLVKPFAMEELIVRIKALSLRRSGQINNLSVGDLTVDLVRKIAVRGGRELKLSPSSFKLLEILMRQSPMPVSREHLMQGLWGDDQPDSNSLKVHIYKLRKELETNADTPLLHTVTGHGFSIRESL
ncbi:two component transcriptional regulator, winged helix family protein [Shewanella sediminis HAW-EB3]|uniref:Two component transcriptional regulator, winged helix family protein n=1 Tax=Shewanella sediminis (strain HAW-EB3) TaxID=425104 RepID=A8FUR0_SHESH|nr:response regulator transcription factor [Shewanella sediminis]ABV36583.1 two component transcriptional regulator, winged helix family protein [Shewanella sediminis HAW-EB3]